MARQREKRAAAKEAERARRARLEQMYESASDWLEKAMGARMLHVAPKSNRQSLRFEKTEYGAVRYVPERRPGYGTVPDRVEYVQKQDTFTNSDYVHLGYTNYLEIELELVGADASGVGEEIELRGEVLYNDKCSFSGYLLLKPPEPDRGEYSIWLPLRGQPADLCEPINRAYKLLQDGWSLESNGGTILNDLVSELEATKWRRRSISSLAKKLQLDEEPLKLTPHAVVRLLARKHGAESWNLLLEQRVVATRWLWGPVWDVDPQGGAWEVRPGEPARAEWENNEYEVECEEDAAYTEPTAFTDVFGAPRENLAEALQKVAELFKAGLLTEEEFRRAKTKLLDSDPEQ